MSQPTTTHTEVARRAITGAEGTIPDHTYYLMEQLIDAHFSGRSSDGQVIPEPFRHVLSDAIGEMVGGVINHILAYGPPSIAEYARFDAWQAAFDHISDRADAWIASQNRS